MKAGTPYAEAVARIAAALEDAYRADDSAEYAIGGRAQCAADMRLILARREIDRARATLEAA
jgi:hypothetical protein